MEGPSSTIVAASIAAAASVLTVLAGQLISARHAHAVDRARKEQEVVARYLNPLRSAALDVGMLISAILQLIRERGDTPLSSISEAGQLRDRGIERLARDDTYLGSSAHVTACLFGELVRLHDANPFLRLGGGVKDTELTAAIWDVGIAFGRNAGIYYAHQGVIGHEVIRSAEGGLISYREFCELLLGERGVWFERLIAFYVEVGQGKRIEQMDAILHSVRALLRLLDSAVGGDDSYTKRLAVEENRPPSIG